MQWVACVVHVISTAVRRAFAPRKIVVEAESENDDSDENDVTNSESENSGVEEPSSQAVGLDKFIRAASYVVRFAKQGSLNEQLQNMQHETLKTFSPTRFCGVLFLLESLLHSYDAVKSLLLQSHNDTVYSKLCEINTNDLSSIVELLRAFHKHISFLEADKIRIPFAVPAFKNLRQVCAPCNSDTTLLKEAKRRLLTELDFKRSSIGTYHHAAHLLHPSFKESKLLSTHQKKAAKELMQSICEKYTTQDVAEDEPVEMQSSETTDEYSKFVVRKTTELSFDQEWSQYLKHHLPDKSSKEVDVLQWWKERRQLFPKLSIPAFRLLPIPDTNTYAERSNSTGKRAQPMTRFLLGDEAFKRLLYYHYDKKA